jgi:hypothetical protein
MAFAQSQNHGKTIRACVLISINSQHTTTNYLGVVTNYLIFRFHEKMRPMQNILASVKCEMKNGTARFRLRRGFPALGSLAHPRVARPCRFRAAAQPHCSTDFRRGQGQSTLIKADASAFKVF